MDDNRAHAQYAISESQSCGGALVYSSYSLNQETNCSNLRKRPSSQLRSLSAGHSQNRSRRWFPEILSCTLSLLCILGKLSSTRCHNSINCCKTDVCLEAIVITLKVYDGQMNPRWPLGITL